MCIFCSFRPKEGLTKRVMEENVPLPDEVLYYPNFHLLLQMHRIKILDVVSLFTCIACNLE